MAQLLWYLLAALVAEDEAVEAENELLQRAEQQQARLFEYSTRRFSLDDYSDAWIEEFLVFSRAEILELVDLFELHALTVQKRYKQDPEFGLCLVLKRLSYPSRLKDLQDLFGLHRSSLSVIFNDTVTYLSRRYTDLLRWHPTELTTEKIAGYADSLERFGTGGIIWGWIDGTFKPFSRPIENQRAWYSGYKKLHGHKYQGVMCPNGLVLSLDGPYCGATNDISMLHRSGLGARLRNRVGRRGRLFLYGDEAYQSATYVLAPFPGGRQLAIDEPHKARFNKEMSSLRISVEQGFGFDQNKWTINAFKLANRGGLMPVAAFVKVSFLLSNCYTCLRGNQISKRFGVDPPSLADYLAPAEGRGLTDSEDD